MTTVSKQYTSEKGVSGKKQNKDLEYKNYQNKKEWKDSTGVLEMKH